MMDTKTQNSNFVCPCCGRGNALPPSVLIMQGNYSSAEHDTERATIKLCGDCFDRLYVIIQSNLPTEAIEIEFTL